MTAPKPDVAELISAAMAVFLCADHADHRDFRIQKYVDGANRLYAAVRADSTRYSALKISCTDMIRVILDEHGE